MIRRPAVLAVCAALLAGCQTSPMPQMFARGPAIDGRWASGDGLSVTTFGGGQLTTRFVETNEVVAQGSYTMAGDSIAMQWVSLRRQEQRSANCTLSGGDAMHCSQPGGGGFDLRRIG